MQIGKIVAREKVWNWYVSNDDEIFIDLDSKHAMLRAFQVLRRAMQRGSLDIDSIWLYPSQRGFPHAHLIVCLKQDMEALQRAMWALWMGSDRIRGIYIVERLRHMVIAADVFSTRTLFEFRPPDDTCTCPTKHKDKKVTDKCPAMKRLMMDQRSAEYFPRNTDRKKLGELHLPWGRVPKATILEWR
jgi:hypothetical protein